MTAQVHKESLKKEENVLLLESLRRKWILLAGEENLNGKTCEVTLGIAGKSTGVKINQMCLINARSTIVS